MKPFFSDKGASKRNITLIDGNNIIKVDLKVVEKFNSSFEDAILSLCINEPSDYISNTMDTCDAVDAIVAKYSSHPSIIKINNFLEKFTFSLNLIEERDIKMQIMGLDSKKASMSDK